MGQFKLRMRFLKVFPQSFPKCRSHMLILSPRLYSEASANKDLFDVLEEKMEEDIGFDQWLATTKEALKNSKGRYWLGKSSPFPYNPAFAPKPIISDSAKSKIFELFKQNPKLNDQRTLALQFKISIERISAIIRQKELELELAKQGKVVDKEFVSTIESNLECVETAQEYVAKDQAKKLPFRPTFVRVPEGRTFNFEDAKNVLISAGINVKSPSINNDAFSGDKETGTKKISTTIICQSDFEKSRSKFIFVNLSKGGNSKSSITVRDQDGSLRTATREEIDEACAKTWNRNRPKI